MTNVRYFVTCGAAVFLLTTGLAVPTGAQTFHETTYLTFNQPVMLPEVTLPAGTYLFELADPSISRQIVRVMSPDRRTAFALLATIPRYRTDPTPHHVVTFSETPEDIAPALKAWFYPGNSNGHEFLYPEAQARYVAAATEQVVLVADIGAAGFGGSGG